MLIQELLEAKKFKKHKHPKKHVKKDDFDDIEDKPEDAEQDKVPQLLIQLRKALDVNGNYPITFKDGNKAMLSLQQIMDFVKKYMVARPEDKESLQNKASNSLESFISVLKTPEKPKFSQKIKGTRYMSHFKGDFDDK